MTNNKRVCIRNERSIESPSINEIFSKNSSIQESHEGMLWYSAAETSHFRNQVGFDARVVARTIETVSAENFTVDDIIKCIGIEKFLSPEMAMTSREKYRLHIDAVLGEQSRQRAGNIRDEARLSRVSEVHSKWSRKRARNLAAGYANMSDE